MKQISSRIKVKEQRSIAYWFVVILIMLIGNVQAQEHPFLIVKESQYAELQARSSNSPWLKMKTDAIAYVNGHSYNPSSSISNRIGMMKDIVSAGALAYILDSANRVSYKDKVLNTLQYWDDIYKDNNTDWGYCVKTGSAFFNSVLALDIIHDDLSSDELSGVESEMDIMAGWLYSNGSWPLNRYGSRGVWALYHGDQSHSAIGQYYSKLTSQLTEDGVFTGGPGYAGARLGDNRDAKAYFMDVLEFTGNGDYYSDTRFQGFNEWLYGYSVSPFGRYYSFGDTGPNRNYHSNGTALYRAYRFSEQAAQYAAWCYDGGSPEGELLSYVLMEESLSTPKKALSKIFYDGGAWFLEDNLSDRSLAGALNNYTSTSLWSHSHKDVNAIHLCAYGEHIVRNSGYCNWGEGAHGFSWDYIHDEAVSGNTVLINGIDHFSKAGGGIVEGFTAPLFNYARGYSGTALANGKHWRNFVFVHPQDDCNGYFVTLDEVDADSSSHKANVITHPNADNSTTISDNLEYRAKIAPHPYSGHTVYLSTFLGTEPSSVEVKDGLLARMPDENASFVGKYLYSTYDSDSSGKCNIVTILFPHDATHAKAEMTRISGSGYSGAEILLGDSITDIALESSDTTGVTCNGISFQGVACLFRLHSDSLGFYFVRGGRSFNDGEVPRHGFTSDANVGVYVKGMEGKITSSSGAEATFFYPGIKNILINGVSASVLDLGIDRITIDVPSGTHDIEFTTVSIPRGTISGTVTDSITGNPIEGATVSDGIRFDDSDAGGNYTLIYVPADTFMITASESDYFSLSVAGVVVTESDTTIVDFQLTEIPTGTVSGRVTDKSTGSPIPDAMVTDGTRSDSTDAGGNYTLTDVPVNSYIISASESRYLSLSVDSVVVTEDDTTTVDFQLIPAFDLVGFWRFEETSGTTAYDSSGSHNDGVLHGPVSTSGRIDLGYKFDGMDDYIEVPGSVSLDGITEAITLIAWVKVPSGIRYSVFSRWVYVDGDERSFVFDIENEKLLFGLSGDGIGGKFLNSANTVTLKQWTHVAATSDGVTMKIYINGELDPNTETPPAVIHPSSADLHIGRWMIGPEVWHYPFDGTMDEVKIYNRALSADEIEADYNRAPVGIDENSVSLPPDGFLQAYPNPFNSSTTIRYKTAATGNVTISIYNLSGQKIRTLVNEVQQTDNHEVVWDGTNAGGGSAGSGIYFCTLNIDNRPIAISKLVILK